MKRDTDRFVVVHKETSAFGDKGYLHIIVDKKTGVHYLRSQYGYGTGLTPLLGADGKPIITKPEDMQ